MFKKLIATITAALFLTATLAPGLAEARDGRDGWRGRDSHYSDRHYRDRGRHHHRDNGDAALAAGVIGLVLGLAIGAAASEPRQDAYRCTDNYQRCARQGGYDDGYYQQQGGYYDAPPAVYAAPAPGYYEDRRGGDACIRQVEQWDPHAGRYVWVNLRVPC